MKIAKAWAVFTVDQNGERQMLEAFEAAQGFTRKDAIEHAASVKDDEMEKYGNDVEVVDGAMQETSIGPMFQEA